MDYYFFKENKRTYLKNIISFFYIFKISKKKYDPIGVPIMKQK